MYIHIVILKVHVSTTFIIFIYFYDISKRKWFFFFFLNLGTHGLRMQKYPKSTSIQKVSGTGTAPFLEYSYFIGQKSECAKLLPRILPL